MKCFHTDEKFCETKTPLFSLQKIKKQSFKTQKETAGFVDRLCEHLSFQSSQVQLYECFIERMAAQRRGQGPGVESLKEVRDEKLDHFLLILTALKTFRSETPSSAAVSQDSVALAFNGVFKILKNPHKTITQCLSALLAAELTNQNAWLTLIRAAEHLRLEELGEKLRQALLREEEHVAKIRTWLAENIFARSIG